MDKLDKRILWNLEYNARMPLTELADKINRSKQNVHYRLKKLQEEGILKGFKTVIDIHRLGYLTYRVYIRYRKVDREKEKEIIKYFQDHDRVLWCVSLSGSWDFEAVFVAKNFIKFNNILKDVKEDLNPHISKYNISMSIVNYHLPRDYLLNKERKEFAHTYYGFEPEQIEIDELDIGILQELSLNCRQQNREIGRKLGVTYQTVKNRIQKLEEKGAISSHRTSIDISKLERTYYKANIRLKNPTKEQEKKLYHYCQKFNFVVYLVEVLGAWELEIEAEVEDQQQFTRFLRKVRNEFPGLIADYDILHVTGEHKLNYLPMGEEAI